MSDQDPDLREAFAHLRHSDHEAAPAFRDTLHRARHASATQSASVPARTAWRWTAGLTATAIAVVALAPVFKPRPSLTQALPVLLPARSALQPFLSQLTDARPGSGSDFLLPFHLDLASL